MTIIPRPGLLLAAVTLAAVCGTAEAQRADENAVTSAQDAFGTSIGLQSVGLYSAADARGFSPQQAGNLRIEGLYYDQQTWTTGECMVRETTMRVGIAAQSYSFPAPTGIADITLRSPGDRLVVSGVLSRGPYNAATADLEAQLPLIDRTLSVDVCAGYRKNFDVDVFRASNASVFGSTFRWRPAAGTEILPFVSFVGGGARQIVPSVYTDGILTPPFFRTRDLGAQAWTGWAWHQTTLGAIVKSTLGGSWTLAAGLFHSREQDPLGYQPYVTLQSDRTADSVLDVAPPFGAASTSGEVRLARTFGTGPHRHRLEISVRGRSVRRVFGGDAIVDLGTVDLDNHAALAQPAWAFLAQNRDSTREVDLGVTLEERWDGWGTVAVGILGDHYRRRVDVATAAADTDTTSPRLLNLRLETDAIGGVVVYGSLVQGLEDSAVAPVSAANRNEPPPATRSWQIDGGLRWSPGGKLQLICGGFDIHKPYFNSDASNVYRQLGRLEHRGLETSLSYSDAGLTALVGGVLLKPRVSRVIAEPGATGIVPLGPVPLTLTANLDYAPPQWGPWAASWQWNRLSTRVATTDNARFLPSFTTVNAGVRYHWTPLQHPWTVRLDGANLTDARGLHLSNLEVVMPEQGRRFTLTLATDF